MERLYIPPREIEKDLESPVVFLAGPIQGTEDWQKRAGEILLDLDPHLLVANPRRGIVWRGDFKNDLYNNQVDWETYHLRLAASNGVVMFWLANETTHLCERAYAQTTRFELAEWKIRHERDGSKLVVGIDSKFTGSRYIERRLGQDCPNVPLCETLEETCQSVIQQIYK